MAISCNCEVTPRVYSYGNSTPEIPVGDQRKRIEDEEYLNDRTIGQMDLPVCESIGTSAFENSSITGIYAPKCTTVEDRAFYGCSSFTANSIEMDSLTTIGNYAFKSVTIGNTHGPLVVNLSNVVTIGNYGLYGSDIARSLGDEWTLPNCTRIGEGGFRGTVDSNESKASKIYLPAIVEIGEQAFRGWGVTGSSDSEFELHIGPNCTHIGGGILSYGYMAGHKIDIYVEAINPPVLDSPGFGDVIPNWEPRHIYVPTQSLQAYKDTSVWSRYNKESGSDPGQNIFQPIPT